MGRRFSLLTALFVPATAAFGFDGHRVTEGPLMAFFDDMEVVAEPEEATAVDLHLENASDGSLKWSV